MIPRRTCTGVEWRLRPAAPSDESFFVDLRATTMGPYWRAEFGDRELNDRQPNGAPSRFNPDQTQIMTVDSEPVGALDIERRNGRLWIHWLLIAPAFQGRGLGTYLVQRVQREAAELSLGVGLEVLPCNTDARRLYERLGFAVQLEVPHSTRMGWRASHRPYTVTTAPLGSPRPAGSRRTGVA